ncbi:TolC family protein [Occallatibacter riparius]|uniref:TolC family protein n=1 Tax=Occallatibacter riparius TaxID=1002689 RepID=A0A9J7BUE5_9BACT|nr:TolC family protein [Occallatibacter riparius]UWZ84550.1 TolC family protein [Occallatibacter riparius]
MRKLLPLTLLVATTCVGQQPARPLPDAPKVADSAELLAQATPPPAGSRPNGQNTPPAATPSPASARLTLAEAEKMALAHNPNISIAHLLQLAQTQVTREVRAGEMPDAVANLTAVGAHDNSRITAGALNNPIVYNRAAGGLTVRQLITDFGRTRNLVKNAQSTAQAQVDTERATVEDITLAVDEAFYQALTAQSVLKVAQQTLAARQATGEQVGALTQQKLRSTLDLSLADVQVSQAKLLVLDAQNSSQAAMASLNAVLGSEADQTYDLVDETPANPQAAPTNTEELVQLAFRQRPDLASLDERFLAAKQFASAEHDLMRPTISALATAGGTPVRADQIQSSWYGAAGANISIPVFNGFEYSARAKEADFRAQAASEQVRNLRETVARDVRSAVLNAQIAFQRIGVTRQLLDQANTSLELAQARYKVGLSGIVDLTQSQLAQTEAEIAYTNARFAYQTALAAVRYQTGQ